MEKEKIIINSHVAVDLGLSVKWATCNIGASNPEEYGDYFAFGETEPKDEYTEENYMLYGIPHGKAYIDIGKTISANNGEMNGESLLKKNYMNYLVTVRGSGLP